MTMTLMTMRQITVMKVVIGLFVLFDLLVRLYDPPLLGPLPLIIATQDRPMGVVVGVMFGHHSSPTHLNITATATTTVVTASMETTVLTAQQEC